MIQYVVTNIQFTIYGSIQIPPTRDQLEACCEVLDRLLEAVSASEILTQFHTEVLQGLGHGAECVQGLSLRQVCCTTYYHSPGEACTTLGPLRCRTVRSCSVK